MKGLQGVLVWASLAGAAAAHGALLDVAEVAGIAVTARYDTGAAMAGAQVSVFAPDAPATPWLTGQTDAAGRFVFLPDDRAGRWAIQVRQAGHGAIGYADLGPTGLGRSGADAMIPASVARAGTTPGQRLLMVACVAWGCIGTALYVRAGVRRAPGRRA